MNAMKSDTRTPLDALRPSPIVTQAPDGRWIVRDRARGLERSFATQRAALHFALFESGDRHGTGCALVIPSARPHARAGG